MPNSQSIGGQKNKNADRFGGHGGTKPIMSWATLLFRVGQNLKKNDFAVSNPNHTMVNFGPNTTWANSTTLCDEVIVGFAQGPEYSCGITAFNVYNVKYNPGTHEMFVMTKNGDEKVLPDGTVNANKKYKLSICLARD